MKNSQLSLGQTLARCPWQAAADIKRGSPHAQGMQAAVPSMAPSLPPNPCSSSILHKKLPRTEVKKLVFINKREGTT